MAGLFLKALRNDIQQFRLIGGVQHNFPGPDGRSRQTKSSNAESQAPRHKNHFFPNIAHNILPFLIL